MKVAHLQYTPENLQEVMDKFYEVSNRLLGSLDRVLEKVGIVSKEVVHAVEVEEKSVALHERRRFILPLWESNDVVAAPIEIDGFVGYYGWVKTGQRTHSESIGIGREIKIYKGNFRVLDGGPTVLEQARKLNNQDFYPGNSLIIPAGEWADIEIRHNILYLTTFISHPESAPL